MSVKMTVSEFAVMTGVEYILASNFLRFLLVQGVVKIVDKRKTANGKGKPSDVWEIPDKLVYEMPKVPPAAVILVDIPSEPLVVTPEVPPATSVVMTENTQAEGSVVVTETYSEAA